MTTGKDKTKGALALFAWAILIAAGIVMKRQYGKADWMMFFHLPAAVMLIMAFAWLSKDFRKKYLEELAIVERRRRIK